MELYEYQKEDVAKATEQKAALIASEMGTGKTIEAIEIFKIWREEVRVTTGLLLPILIVTPQNTFESWLDKLNKQMPKWNVLVLERTQKGREAFVNAISMFEADVYICNYESMRVMQERFTERKFVFSVICADECHAISNHEALQSKALKKLKTYHKLAMSGTPSGAKPWKIWSVFNWLWPTYYTSFWKFVGKYCIADDGKYTGYRKITGMKNLDILHWEIAPWYIRHNKKTQCCDHHPDGVMSYLPDKNYEKLYVDLTPQQRRVYESMRKEMVAWVGEQMETPFVARIAAVKLMRLMQITLATPNVSWTDEGQQLVLLEDPSPKIDLVEELVTDNAEENFLVYTNSKKAAYLCGKRLQDAGIPTLVLSGDTPTAERQAFVTLFQKKQIRVIVAVIRASEGFDGLQDVCDTIIFMNRDLSAVKNQQAEDRLHRQGQHNPVTIIDLVARNTLDDARLDIDSTNWKQIVQLLNTNTNINVTEAA